jgi:NADH dehydrogenase
MFGPDDAFLTRMVKLIRTLPVYPMFGRGQIRLQPVYVDDVAEAIARVLDRSEGADRSCYELGGPRIYTYRELLQSIAREMGTRVRTAPIPFAAWQALAGVAEFLPGKPLTRNQIALMEHDNIASDDLPGLPELSVTPTALEAIVHQITGRRPG